MPKSEVPEQVRHAADAIKLALREMVHEDPDVLRDLVEAAWGHAGEHVSRSVGRKMISMVAGALFAGAIWMISLKWGGK